MGRSKSRSISAVPSSEEVAPTLSLPEKDEEKCLIEDTQGECSSSGNKDPTTKVLDVTAKPKSKRRKSFTSLLVNGSKVRNFISCCVSCDFFFSNIYEFGNFTCSSMRKMVKPHSQKSFQTLMMNPISWKLQNMWMTYISSIGLQR